MKTLKGIHDGQTAWIVGKGPSLRYLKKTDFGPGPVITINSAIVAVESLGLENPVYSMQKDGGERRNAKWAFEPLNAWHSDPCKHAGALCDDCKGIVRPKGATLLVHEWESKFCLPDYPKRIVFDVLELGMPQNEFSMIVAAYMARYMGCKDIVFVCCDAHAISDYRLLSDDGKTGNKNRYYIFQTFVSGKYLSEFQHSFITPCGGGDT